MKKLIPLLLLLISIANLAFSQDSVRIWITPAQEARVYQLKNDYHALQIGFAFLQQENKALRLENIRLQHTLDSLNTVLSILVIKNSKCRDLAELLTVRMGKEIEIRKGYKDLAEQKSMEAIKAKKWRGKYYGVATFKMTEMIVVNALFATAIIILTNTF